MADVLALLMGAIGDQLATIRTGNGYGTDIGELVLPDAVQRAETERPSVAYGATAGVIDRTDEVDAKGNALSSRARKVEFTIEAAVDSGIEESRAAALAMLHDIDGAFAAGNCIAPPGVKSVTLKTWSILDRPDGIDAVVLQILGEAEYLRSTT